MGATLKWVDFLMDVFFDILLSAPVSGKMHGNASCH